MKDAAFWGSTNTVSIAKENSLFLWWPRFSRNGGEGRLFETGVYDPQSTSSHGRPQLVNVRCCLVAPKVQHPQVVEMAKQMPAAGDLTGSQLQPGGKHQVRSEMAVRERAICTSHIVPVFKGKRRTASHEAHTGAGGGLRAGAGDWAARGCNKEAWLPDIPHTR